MQTFDFQPLKKFTQTDTHTDGRTSRLSDWISLGADSVKMYVGYLCVYIFSNNMENHLREKKYLQKLVYLVYTILDIHL